MSEQPQQRSCSKQTCTRAAVCTLTYVYSDSTAVIGALSARSEPHAYDLCAFHADRMTAPRGWRVVRLESQGDGNRDDLGAVVNAVRDDDPPQRRRAAPSPRQSIRPVTRMLRDVSMGPASERPTGNTPQSNADGAAQAEPPRLRSAPLPEGMRRAHLRRP